MLATLIKSARLPVLGMALLLSACAQQAARLDSGKWAEYKHQLITSEGRVVDTGNNRISHSEGQGTGMLLAAAHQDKETFQRLWGWTRATLQIRSDKLFAWKWSHDSKSVADLNNASDGDILIAWALYRAGRQWRRQDYLDAAREISHDIKAKLLRRTKRGLVILPAESGFEDTQGTIVNLSYWVFPAFADFNTFDPAPEWNELTQSGLHLLGTARFGRWRLPPDWLALSEPPALPEKFDPTFGYNAIRIPLYLVWAKHADMESLRPFVEFWDFFDGARFISPSVNLKNNYIDSDDASPGIRAIIDLTRQTAKVKASKATRENSVQDYYSFSLFLLTNLAQTEAAAQ